MLRSTLVLLTLFQTQSDPTRQVRDLVERLRSENVEERDEAAQKLKDLGRAAIPELENAVGDKDGEVPSRARRLLLLIPMAEQVTTNLTRTVPGILERLAMGADRDWTKALLEIVRESGRKHRYPALKREDFDALGSRTVRDAATPEEKSELCKLAAQWGLRSAIPEVTNLLGDPARHVRYQAAECLGNLRAKVAIHELMTLLKDRDG